MVVGIDVYHDGGKGGRSIAGFVASTNKQFTRWYSRVCFQQQGQELIDGLKLNFTASLRKYHEVCNLHLELNNLPSLSSLSIFFTLFFFFFTVFYITYT